MTSDRPVKPPISPGRDATPGKQDDSEHVQSDESSRHKESTVKHCWNIWKRWQEGQTSDWWFASTGIPLLAATLGPLANVSSIAALVTSWRQTNPSDPKITTDFDGVPYADPRWCYWLNVASLICGFLGNVFLLLNFVQRIRYIIALPATIIFWHLSSGFLIAITVCMEIYDPPHRPDEIYTQGFWYAIAAAALYTLCSMILMVNMLGFFMGHYPENFALSESQRTLILQTMAFLTWLAGGAAMFSKLESNSGIVDWSFSDALYFCDVTILTVGFGDIVPTTDLGRGLVFPFSVGGIITLALVVSSLYRAIREIGEENVFQKHSQRMRERALEHTVTNSFDLRHREGGHHNGHIASHLVISNPIYPRPYWTAIDRTSSHTSGMRRRPKVLRVYKKPRLLILKEEKDRFEAMRKIQMDSKQFRSWMALGWSVTLFSVLWCVGAVVFWQSEQQRQGLTYFQSLYFCYVSLLTIGYGDLAPKSNAGRCFFVIWSLIAVPSMTILVSDLGDTVVAKFKRGSDGLADFTVLPQRGIWRDFLERHPWLLNWLQSHIADRAAKKRLKRGFDTMDPREESDEGPPSLFEHDLENPEEVNDIEMTRYATIATLATEAEQDTSTVPSRGSLSRRLALEIRKVSRDMRLTYLKRYSYEEWVEFTRLIRLTTPGRLNQHLGADIEETENDEGLVNWDWIGDDSPMVSQMSESEWLLERLCESLIRLERRREVASDNCDLTAIRSLEHREHVVPSVTPLVPRVRLSSRSSKHRLRIV